MKSAYAVQSFPRFKINREAVEMGDLAEPPICITQNPGFQAVSKQLGTSDSFVPI